ncbi:MAG: 16S rRNA (cytidine(1402)-2'-O)-methyltransferase [Ignavibacteriales bacterium]
MIADREGARAMAAGTLFLVGTPIGNLEDMTLRAIRVLGEVAVIAAEDTRHTRALCAHFGIHRRIMSYREHNRDSAGQKILEMLRQGKSVAVVSDAGMPGLSDPGCELVSRCLDEGIRVTPVPGPSAAIAALVSSGLCNRGFIFEGFLPRARARRLETLRRLESDPRPAIIYESPRRVARTLREIAETLGPRSVAVARELTKVHEEIIRAPALEAAQAVGPSPLGEFVIVVAGARASRSDAGPAHDARAVGAGCAGDADYADLAGQVRRLEESGVSRMDAIKTVARAAGMSKRDLYAEIERLKRERW